MGKSPGRKGVEGDRDGDAKRMRNPRGFGNQVKLLRICVDATRNLRGDQRDFRLSGLQAKA